MIVVEKKLVAIIVTMRIIIMVTITPIARK